MNDRLTLSSSITAHKIVFCANGGRPVLAIKSDGTIVSEATDIDEDAQAVLKALEPYLHGIRAEAWQRGKEGLPL